MPTYITLMNWTDQGVKTASETVHRREQADALAQKHGATAMLLELGSQGNLRTTTLRAYDRDQMSGIIQRLG